MLVQTLSVAITRAMEECHLSLARQRFRNGSVTFASASRFLNDIDRRYVEIVRAAQTAYRPTFTPTWSTPSIPDIPSMSIAPQKKTTTPVSGSAAPIDASTWKTGDRVSHRVFGNGSVQRVYHDSVTENDKIEISFDGVGTKTLLLSHAKLERLD